MSDDLTKSPNSPPRLQRARLNGPALFFLVPAVLAIGFQVCTRVVNPPASPEASTFPLDGPPARSAARGCSGPFGGRSVPARASETRATPSGCGASLFGPRSSTGVSDTGASDAEPHSNEPTARNGSLVGNSAAFDARASAPPSNGAEEPSVARGQDAAKQPGAATGALTPEAEVTALIEGYYRDLNAGTLEASQYFAPSIERYISMTGTSPTAINSYIHGLFKKQFQNPVFKYEPGSLAREPDGSFTFAEKSQYFFVAKKRQVEQRYRVRVRVEQGKMVFFQQFQKLPSVASPLPSLADP
jgi:hypothetical protein